MLELEPILEVFALFADLTPQQAQRYTPLCRQAAAALEQQLRPELDATPRLERLHTAAGGLAYCDYAVLRESSCGGGIKVGEVALSSDAAGLRALEELRRQFLAQVADCLQPQGALLQVI